MNPRLAYRIQIGSGLIFATFLLVHLASVSAGLWGAEAFDRVMEGVRPLYRNWAAEALLLAAVLAHAVTSLYFWWRRPPGAPRRPTALLQSAAGFVLLIFLIGHVAFFRVAPALYDFTPRFDYLWVAYRVWPTLFAPYYLLFGVAAAFHLAFGARQAFKRREGYAMLVVYALLSGWMFVVGVRLPTLDATPPDDATLQKYLRPYETFTPWLIDMGEEHELVRRYLGKPPLER